MLGTVSEYVVNSADTSTELIDEIKAQELQQDPKLVPSNFVLKKLGVLSTSNGEIYINNKLFTLMKNQSLELGYGVTDVYSLKCNTAGIKLIIRYLY